jgi:hypothetical protein
MSGNRRRFLIAIAFIGIILLLLVFWPARNTLTVSSDMTYVTGPLDPDGYVDYVSALNERLSSGITPETNSNVLIWKTLGPHPEGATMPADYFKWLGFNPPEQGDYFITTRKYLEESAKISDRTKCDELNIHFSDLAMKIWLPVDEPELLGWLKANERPIQTLIEATRRPQYYNPIVPRESEDGRGMLINSLLPNVQKCRELAQALCCRAMLRTGEGKLDDAWADLMACRRLARLLVRGGTLIESLVGIAIEAIGDRAIAVFLSQEKLDSTKLLACLKELQAVPGRTSVADNLDLTERFVCLDIVIFIARGTMDLDSLDGFSGPKKKKSFFEKTFKRSVNWDPALKYINDVYNRCVAGSRLTDRAARTQASAELELEIAANKPDEASLATSLALGPSERGRQIGYMIAALLLPAFDKVQSAFDRNVQFDRNTQLALALAAYRADNGNYPTKLEDLAPKYIAAIPDDLFSGKPLIYRQIGKGYLLYSVGANGIDDDGKGVYDEPKGDDIVVRIPPSVAVDKK